ncbi:hypothetical protein A176_006552 [Myxococcus hansupus]|uniref:Uncharacterized protein n=1 Tax=Pseudomyxococcus hansupus TaxID=1297742 RepID=A0A0H4X7U0_9BACT|nr:hypothetical protein [Myxococcus hansupus]AKQ69640.1 hypothetical protein A176_006552 [Myxococcus hansupus]
MRYAVVMGVTLASWGAAAEERWTAPYQVEDASGRTVRVILGEAAPDDVASRLRVMTLVGKQGLAEARFQRTEPVCVGGEDDSDLPPVCHTVGVYTQLPGTPDIGEPLVALAGAVNGTVGAPDATTPRKRPVPGHWTSTPFERAVDEGADPYMPADAPAPRYRWHPGADGRVALELQHYERTSSQVTLESCTEERQGPFTRLECVPTPPFVTPDIPQPLSMLYAGRTLLVASFEDYGEPETTLVASLHVAGDTQYLVRVGLKGQAVTGLLFREGNTWRLLLRPADYPVLGC